MSNPIHLVSPLDASVVSELRAGDSVRLTGIVYTARDAAHRRICEALARGEQSPLPLKDAVIYYAGPAPTPPGKPIGPVGPTTSYRMDPYAPELLDRGVRAMIGKGTRSPEVHDAIVRNHAVYFAAIGGVAALIGRCVKSAEVIAYEDLGAEAVRKLEVVDLPLTVAIDSTGADLYEIGPALWKKQQQESEQQEGGWTH